MHSGRLNEVKSNIGHYGELLVCEFVPGFFFRYLKRLTDPIAFAFLDVDLASSMRDSLKYIWPLLMEGQSVYTDDACDMEVMRVWFDEDWWQSEIGQALPIM